jgi:hypothetical protein
MKIFQQGDHGVAIAPELGRVRVVYRYRKLTLESGIEVENVLVGVHQDTGEVLVIPAQSAPRIKEAREGAKAAVLEARIPRELKDVLELLADRYGVTPKKFTPALIRFYLHSAAAHPPLARRLGRLSRGHLAKGTLSGRSRVRCGPRLSADMAQLAGAFEETSLSDLVRGAILAAKEDVLDKRSMRRTEQLEAVAAAV